MTPKDLVGAYILRYLGAIARMMIKEECSKLLRQMSFSPISVAVTVFNKGKFRRRVIKF